MAITATSSSMKSSGFCCVPVSNRCDRDDTKVFGSHPTMTQPHKNCIQTLAKLIMHWTITVQTVTIINEMELFWIWPSLLPTVLKYPAENPPVNAPWNLRRPWASRTVCSCNPTGLRMTASSTKQCSTTVETDSYMTYDSSHESLKARSQACFGPPAGRPAHAGL